MMNTVAWRVRGMILTDKGMAKLKGTVSLLSARELATKTHMPESTVRNILNRKGSDSFSLRTFFGKLGLALEESDYEARDSLSNEPDEIPTTLQHVYDFSRLIEEKAQGFVGRQFAIEAIDKFIAEMPCGYFLVRGDPGIGKTALAAKLVTTRGYVHHFNIRAAGIGKAADFLRNICSQLIIAYDLPHTSLLAEATLEGEFFRRLLEEISK